MICICGTRESDTHTDRPKSIKQTHFTTHLQSTYASKLGQFKFSQIITLQYDCIILHQYMMQLYVYSKDIIKIKQQYDHKIIIRTKNLMHFLTSVESRHFTKTVNTFSSQINILIKYMLKQYSVLLNAVNAKLIPVIQYL